MKHKINILIPIFIALVLIYTIRSVAGDHIQVETLHRGSMEDVINTKGILVKYETLLPLDTEGVFEPLVQDGSRVSVGQRVAAIYSENVDANLKNRLEQVKKKIEQIEANQTNLLSFTGDVSRLEQKIQEQVGAMIQASQNGDMATVSELQFIIESLCEKKAQVSGGGASGGTLETLQAQRSELEAQIGTAHRQIASPAAGVFTSSVDGLEEVLTPYNMADLRPSTVSSLLEQKTSGEGKAEASACKVVNNFRYFVAVNLPAERIGTLRIDDKVNLRFFDLSKELFSAYVQNISPEEDGSKTVILCCDRYIESLLKCRFVNVEFVRKRYQGYRVSVKSLRSQNDVTGVYVRRDDVLKFIPVTILYNTQDVAIVDSADKDLPLRLYDEVVVRASSYEEGKLLR